MDERGIKKENSEEKKIYNTSTSRITVINETKISPQELQKIAKELNLESELPIVIDLQNYNIVKKQITTMLVKNPDTQKKDTEVVNKILELASYGALNTVEDILVICASYSKKIPISTVQNIFNILKEVKKQ